jgi:CBS domain-containing protein
MEQNQIRRLVVLSREDQTLVGVVSLGDLARATGTDTSGKVLKEVSAPETSEPAKDA